MHGQEAFIHQMSSRVELYRNIFQPRVGLRLHPAFSSIWSVLFSQFSRFTSSGQFTSHFSFSRPPTPTPIHCIPVCLLWKLLLPLLRRSCPYPPPHANENPFDPFALALSTFLAFWGRGLEQGGRRLAADLPEKASGSSRISEEARIHAYAEHARPSRSCQCSGEEDAGVVRSSRSSGEDCQLTQ